MKTVEVKRYGTVAVSEAAMPEIAEGEVLVRVIATSVNPTDWYGFIGRPYLARPISGVRRPRSRAIGVDFAGVVHDSGTTVGGFRAGDEVFGYAAGAFAELVTVGEAVHHKPPSLSFEQAAALPLAGLTALQGLRDHGAVQPGQRVLINGASGGVGTVAVQIASALGAEVHAVCSARNVDQARELGADQVFDYTREDFTRSGERYDVIFDGAGNRPWRAMRRALAPAGTVVVVGGPRSRRVLGPLGHIAGTLAAARFSRQRAVFFMAKPNRSDLDALAQMVERHQLKPIVARHFAFDQIADALAEIGVGHAQGKVVVSVGESTSRRQSSSVCREAAAR
jgi:NADPH:quinone reductase-like Zn-dependent oxidoreductase